MKIMGIPHHVHSLEHAKFISRCFFLSIFKEIAAPSSSKCLGVPTNQADRKSAEAHLITSQYQPLLSKSAAAPTTTLALSAVGI